MRRIEGTRLSPRPGVLGALVLTVMSVACQGPAPSNQTLELTEGWEFRRADLPPGPSFPGDLADPLSAWIPATIPGTIHTDLLNAELISDPFFRSNEMALQWIGEEGWIYRTSFQASPGLLEKETVELVFHGLDTFAEVRLNDRPILRADNMFRIWSVEVKDLLRSGENTLEIHLSSPLPPALDARAALPYELPAGNDRGDPPSRVFVRKAAYHYGWDWGPRLVTSGIWRPVEITGWSGGRITDLYLTTDSISGETAFLTGSVEILISREEADRRTAGGNVPINVTLSSPDGAFAAVEQELVVESGTNQIAFGLMVEDPQLWWPNGSGDPHLYTAQASIKAGRNTDTLTTRFGVRTVELVTEPDTIGESFFFRVNGIPVFMKGANVIPLDHFSPRVTEDDYKSLFQDAVEANMNMLRVWGGGIYEEDTFYDIADEYGVLIWQDFMFANGMYPGDSAFLANVEAEATDQVRRLRGHASIALWCGNNEMDEGWHRWGWARNYDTPQDSAAVRDAYENIFHRILPGVVEAEDPGRRYWPSSPSLGWGDPESLNRGDSHYWGVWHGQEPFQVYAEKLPRFSSEFGFQAFPSMETVAAFTYPEDRSLFDPTLLTHQKHPIGNELILEYMERDYPVPEGFDDFVYVSQLLQARGMRTAFEAHRRAMPRTMGTLYWQLNDTWPVVSWSGRDYFGRWKALHYAAKHAFAPTLVSSVLGEASVEVWGVHEAAGPLNGSLRLRLLEFSGAVLWEDSVEVSLGERESSVLWRSPVTWPSPLTESEELDTRRAVFVAELTRDPSAEGPNPSLLFFHPPKDLDLGVPTIRFELEEAGVGSHRITLDTDVLAKGVYLMLENGSFSDNFFDLLPGQSHRVSIETDKTLDQVRTELRIRTLAEVPKEGVDVENSG